MLATYGDLDALSAEVRTSAAPPVMPPYEQCLGPADGPVAIPGSSAITERLNIRLDPATVGWAVGAPSGKGRCAAGSRSRTAVTRTRSRCS